MVRLLVRSSGGSGLHWLAVRRRGAGAGASGSRLSSEPSGPGPELWPRSSPAVPRRSSAPAAAIAARGRGGCRDRPGCTRPGGTGPAPG